MAEGIFNALQMPNFQAKSAGLYTQNGLPASIYANIFCEKVGKYYHQSQMLTEDLITWADLILTMTVEHKQWIENIYHKNLSLYTLKEYIGDKDLNISDPYGQGEVVYQRTFAELERVIHLLIEKISKKKQ